MTTPPAEDAPYAYQVWHCHYCEERYGHAGSVVDSARGAGHAMHCESCGTAYDWAGNHVPDEEPS